MTQIKISIPFKILFFTIMAVYGLIKEFRDAFFITYIGISNLPIAKIGSLLCLFLGMIIYQHMIDKFKEIKTFSYIILFYIFFLSIYVFFFFYLPIISSFYVYLFYFILEGYSPFVWNILWSILIINYNYCIDQISLKASYYANIGAFLVTYSLALLLSSSKFYFTENKIFAFILSGAIIFLCISYLYLKKIKQSNNLIKINLIEKNELSFLQNFTTIFTSKYIFALFLITALWEFINTLFNYMRLDTLFINSSESGIILLCNLYKSISLTYGIGVIILISGTSFLTNKLGIKKTLFLMPFFTCIIIITLYLDKNGHTVIWMYMILKSLYPSLIFPIKESLYAITNHSIQFKTKTWIAAFGARLAKTSTAFYMQSIIFLSPITQKKTHILILILLVLIYSITITFLNNTYNLKNKKTEESETDTI